MGLDWEKLKQGWKRLEQGWNRREQGWNRLDWVMTGPGQGQSRAEKVLEQGKSEAELGGSTAGVGRRRTGLEIGRGAIAKLDLDCARAELKWAGAELD